MNDKYNAFEDGEVLGAVGVHESADDTNADHQERLVPVYALAWGPSRGEEFHATYQLDNGILPVLHRIFRVVDGSHGQDDDRGRVCLSGGKSVDISQLSMSAYA